MILCFSGTGNSLAVARRLSEALGGEEIVRVDGELLSRVARGWTPGAKDGDNRVIWVFPVYAWGVPEIVERLIGSVSFGPAVTAHHMVATCGDDIGLTASQWRRLMAARGFAARLAFSVAMPNTYVFLPGFDWDKPKVAEAKTAAMPARVDEIARRIVTEPDATADDVTEGALPGLKSGLLRSAFNRWLTSPRGFRVDASRCTGCGTCVRACPLANVKLGPGRRPVWGADCTFCTACFNKCPERAISWRLL